MPLNIAVHVGDGKQRKEFERQVAERGLEKFFSFLGLRNDVPHILACCDIAVLPSEAEGLPNAVLEYMAAGLPTVASRVGGNAEIVQDGKTGLLVPPQDSYALAEALLRLLRNPDFAAGMGMKGRECVAAHFSFQRMVENTDQLYTELLRSKVRGDLACVRQFAEFLLAVADRKRLDLIAANLGGQRGNRA